MLVISMMLSSLVGSWDVMAAGTAPKPIITLAAAGSKEVKGKGLLGSNRRKGLNITTTIYVTVKNGSDTVEEASTVIGPKETPKTDGVSGMWTVNLQNELVAGQTVHVKQQCNTDMSDEVSAVVKEALASKHKDDLKMPTGEIWIEQTSSNQVNKDEQAEAVQMLKDANTAIAGDIKSVKFSIDSTDHAYYEVTYTDGSTSGQVEAQNLKIKQVTETSRGYILDPYNVASSEITGKIAGDEPFDGIKVQIIMTIDNDEVDKFCDKKCNIDKSTISKTLDVDVSTGKFKFEVGDLDLKLGTKWGIAVKEPHKFKYCNSQAPELKIPKVDVKDPKKLTKEEKEKIADAIRKANTTPSGISKLPDWTAYNIPAIIEITDDGKVKIINPSDVVGTWDSTYTKFTPDTNPDGTVKIKTGSESNPITLGEKEPLVKNLASDLPKLENKNGNVTITPNIKVDTDAKTVEVKYEGADGTKKTVTATKTDTGWKVDASNATVDKNGVVSIPTKDIKTGSTVKATVIDEGNLIAKDPKSDKNQSELKIENKYKVVYKAGEGSGKMDDQEVDAGQEYTILKNTFTAPTDKEFDYWQVGFEKKKAGEKIVVNNDVEITAIYKYVINPTAGEVETTVGHPVSYKMYKDAIKDFPTALKVEHIKVVTPPDISKTGGTQAEIEVRFSDGQFRTVPITVNVKPDPKDKEIEKLNKDIEGLNKQITELNNKISEKDNKITELNGKITELEGKLQECKNQCAIDKAECEKAKEALNKQIQDLTVEKTRLETVVHDYDELIKELRAHKETLNKQITDLKETVKGKDAEIAKLLEKNRWT